MLYAKAGVSKKKTTMDKIRDIIYVIKSYLNLEPCAYCGKETEPAYFCHKCFPKG